MTLRRLTGAFTVVITCLVVNHPGMCRYEEMDENKGVVRNDTLSVKEG